MSKKGNRDAFGREARLSFVIIGLCLIRQAVQTCQSALGLLDGTGRDKSRVAR